MKWPTAKWAADDLLDDFDLRENEWRGNKRLDVSKPQAKMMVKNLVYFDVQNEEMTLIIHFGPKWRIMPVGIDLILA